MRVIEKQMIEAIKDRRPWKSGNTEVSLCRREDDKPLARVYLHGNHIATVGYASDQPAGDFEVTNLSVSLAGWNTPTTRSRLTALCQAFGLHCHGVGTTKGQAAIRYAIKSKCRNISNTEWVKV
jgi:hypothetical protein